MGRKPSRQVGRWTPRASQRPIQTPPSAACPCRWEDTSGSGLAMMVEILCGVLSGGAMGVEGGGHTDPWRSPSARARRLWPSTWADSCPWMSFQQRVEWLVQTVRSAAPAKGYDEVMVAGDPECRAERERRHHGIPIGEGTLHCLAETANRLGVGPLSDKLSQPLKGGLI